MVERSDHCRYVLEPPKIHNGRIYLYERRYCRRKAQEHGRCWQHHDGSYFCQKCADEEVSSG